MKKYFVAFSLAMIGCMMVLAESEYRGLSFGEFDKKASSGAELNVVFLGGSLTWGAMASNPEMTSARALVGQYLVSRYPKSAVHLIDAAIGGTGSELGLFRIERDVLRYKPDLVFVDCTVNDGIFQDDVEHLYTYETILRKLIQCGVPTMQVLFGVRNSFHKETTPRKRRRQHLALNKYYHLGLGDVYPEMFNALRQGKITLSKAYQGKESTHPDDLGYAVFADAIIKGYESAVKNNLRPILPQNPLYGFYRNYCRKELSSCSLPKGWKVVPTQRTALWFDGQASRWMGPLAEGHESSVPLNLKTVGSFLELFGEGSDNSLNFVIRIDGKKIAPDGKLVRLSDKSPEKEWDISTRRFKGLRGNLFYRVVISLALEDCVHAVEIIPIKTAGVSEGNLRIGSICYAGSLVTEQGK